MSDPAPIAGFDIDHPATESHQAHPVPLLFGLLAAPNAWMIQLLYAFTATSSVCGGAIGRPIPGWLAPTIIAANCCGLAIAVASFVTALGLLRRVIRERQQRSGNALAIADGRTRCLAAWGVSISLAFFIAMLASSISLFLVPLCAS